MRTLLTVSRQISRSRELEASHWLAQTFCVCFTAPLQVFAHFINTPSFSRLSLDFSGILLRFYCRFAAEIVLKTYKDHSARARFDGFH